MSRALPDVWPELSRRARGVEKEAEVPGSARPAEQYAAHFHHFSRNRKLQEPKFSAMPANVFVLTNTNAIHPFRIDIPEPELADLPA
jgi:hypothetical protein